MSKKKDIEVIFRKDNISSGVINTIGGVITYFYLTVIDPAPTDEASIRSLDTPTFFIFIVMLIGLIVFGRVLGEKLKKKFKKWYILIETGETNPADVPINIKRDILNYPLYVVGIAITMWGSAGIMAAYLNQSYRVLIGIIGWGGSVVVILLYFVEDLLWRPIIPTFFPDGKLSEAPALQLSIFWKLLIAFLLIGILPPTLLVFLTWQRVQVLLHAQNPETVLDNLHLLQTFILGASVITSVGLAFFTTRDISNPLNALRRAMERVQEDDLDAKVVVTTNDEFGYLGEHFNQMTAELRQKESLFNANVQLREQLAEIKRLESVLREQAIRDPLTGLFNRRYMEEAFQQELARVSRHEKHTSVVMIDLDNLKEINDMYGHTGGGDQALLLLSEKIGSLCRTEDTFCRYAGDEFLAILRDMSQEVAYKRVMEWKEAVSKAKINTEGKEFGITFSAGIATFPAHGLDAEKLIQSADKALYRAKDAGRNCVVIYNAD